jgi:hypothetical protein
MSIKLSESQRVLLRGASQRDDLHLSVPIGAKLAQTLRAATKLLEAGLIKEVKATKDGPVWRRNEDTGQAYAFKLTAAGARAIAADESNRVEKPAPQAPGGDATTNEATRTTSDAANLVGRVEPGCAATAPVSPRAGTKIAAVVAMLAGDKGATIDELFAATGWLPHTTRAALTGLRKRGYALTSDRPDRTRGSIYRIAPARSSDEATEAVATAGGAVARDIGLSESGADDQPVRRKHRTGATRSSAKARTRKVA